MDFVWVVLGIAVVAAVLFVVATAIFGPGERPEQSSSEVPAPLPPARDLTADDLRAMELPVVARGYRMSDVDALIERLAAQLEQPRLGDADAEGPTPPDQDVNRHQA